MKGKIKQLKIVAIAFGVIFLLMILNLIYLDFKVSELSKNQNILLESR